jgi:hypothetical protein
MGAGAASTASAVEAGMAKKATSPRMTDAEKLMIHEHLLRTKGHPNLEKLREKMALELGSVKTMAQMKTYLKNPKGKAALKEAVALGEASTPTPYEGDA